MNQKIKHLLITIIGITVLGLVFLFINPESKSIIYIFIPVILVWITLYNGVKLLMDIFLQKTTKLQTVFAFVGVTLLILLFLLSGIGQLTVRDIVIVFFLALISAFYFYRTWA